MNLPSDVELVQAGNAMVTAGALLALGETIITASSLAAAAVITLCSDAGSAVRSRDHLYSWRHGLPRDARSMGFRVLDVRRKGLVTVA
jgi:hypothetical protein